MSERSITQFFSALGAPLRMLRQSWGQSKLMALYSSACGKTVAIRMMGNGTSS